MNDLTGKKFGKLLILEKCGKTRFNNIKWKCKCDCGNETIVVGSDIIRYNVKSCGCLKSQLAEKNPLWTGYGEISGSFLGSIKRQAKQNKKEFNLDIEYLWNLFVKQQETCALTGIKLKINCPYKINDRTASLDRINSSKGYIEGNVQWVHKVVNMMKRNLTDEEFVSWCKLVANYNEHEIVRRLNE